MLERWILPIQRDFQTASTSVPRSMNWVLYLALAVVRSLLFIGVCILKAADLDTDRVPNIDPFNQTDD